MAGAGTAPLIGQSNQPRSLYEQPIKAPATITLLYDRPSYRHERAFDVALAVLFLAMLAPLMLACLIAVAMSGPGPLIFRQKRIGHRGKEFTCLKFRTMNCDGIASFEELLRRNPEARRQWESVRKLSVDPRVTRIGLFMRRYSLDELPQLVNVLRGDMSIVGPRPIVAAEIDRYGPRFGDYCAVRPGLTGLWQVSGHNRCSYDERVRFDATYAHDKSIRTDLAILWRTVPVVLFGDNQ